MAINHLLNQDGTIENRESGTDRHGNRSFGDARDVKIRFQRTNRTTMTAEREREPIDGIVFLSPDETVDTGDRITYAGQQYRVIKCEPVVLGNGVVHHYELMVQLWSFGA